MNGTQVAGLALGSGTVRYDVTEPGTVRTRAGDAGSDIMYGTYLP
jgi:hypothetical protein